MWERDFRRRNIPAYRRTFGSTRGPGPSPETHRKINPDHSRRNSLRPWRSAKVLQSSKSEPLLNVGEAAEELYRRQTCRDIFSSPEKCSQVYNKECKVVVNVTVEGSPGAVRTMVKLGSSVEDTIKLVINKYNEEGRTPPLHKHSSAIFELHHSYFSLHSLSKSELIGEVGGTRNFYLRCVSTPSNQPPPPSLSFISSFIGRKIATFIQKTRKFWKIFGCMP